MEKHFTLKCPPSPQPENPSRKRFLFGDVQCPYSLRETVVTFSCSNPADQSILLVRVPQVLFHKLLEYMHTETVAVYFIFSQRLKKKKKNCLQTHSLQNEKTEQKRCSSLHMPEQQGQQRSKRQVKLQHDQIKVIHSQKQTK